MQVVTIDRQGRALQRVVHLRERDGEDLMWVAAGNAGPWIVSFDKGTPSPFSAKSYTVPAGGPVQTNGGVAPGTAGSTYKYSIKDARTNAVTDDPDVDVEP